MRSRKNQSAVGLDAWDRRAKTAAGWALAIAVLLLCPLSNGAAPDPGVGAAPARAGNVRRVLTGWGGGRADDVVPRAAAVGFAELVVHHDDRANFSRFIELGRRHGLDVYAWLHLGDMTAWNNAHPGAPPPLQEMDETERRALERIRADRSPGKSGYQFGGEPVAGIEVLETPLLCFHDDRVAIAFERQIDGMLRSPGAAGVAFDYVGYRNYRCCRCATSRRALADYVRHHPDLAPERAAERFSLDTLVGFVHRLAARARAVAPAARVLIHVYPVFLPEPLYGNRLDVDVCAQSAAWYFEPFWSIEKIRAYSRAISTGANLHHARPSGAAFIGYGKERIKSGDRLSAELDAILEGGCTCVHVCSLNAVLDAPEAAAAFRRLFGHQQSGSRPMVHPPR